MSFRLTPYSLLPTLFLNPIGLEEIPRLARDGKDRFTMEVIRALLTKCGMEFQASNTQRVIKLFGAWFLELGSWNLELGSWSLLSNGVDMIGILHTILFYRKEVLT